MTIGIIVKASKCQTNKLVLIKGMTVKTKLIIV
jgi:hypothetical protein